MSGIGLLLIKENPRSEHVHKVKRSLGRAYIIVRATAIHFLSAVGAAILVVARICPAEAYLCLEIPVSVENPGIAVGNTQP